MDEVVLELDAAGFEDRGDERSAETEVALLVALGDGLAGLVSLDDGADVRGADGDHGDESEGAGVDGHALTLVLPEIRGAAAQGDRVDGVELALGEHGFAGDAGDREVEAMVVDGAEARADDGAAGVAFAERAVRDERRDVEGLAFREDALHRAGVRETEVTAIGGQHRHLRARVDRARLGLELTVEELVERPVRGRVRLRELRRIEAEGLYERNHAFGAARAVRQEAVEVGEKRAFHDGVQRQLPQRVAVDALQPRLAEDPLDLGAAGVAIAEGDRGVGIHVSRFAKKGLQGNH